MALLAKCFHKDRQKERNGFLLSDVNFCFLLLISTLLQFSHDRCALFYFAGHSLVINTVVFFNLIKLNLLLENLPHHSVSWWINTKLVHWHSRTEFVGTTEGKNLLYLLSLHHHHHHRYVPFYRNFNSLLLNYKNITVYSVSNFTKILLSNHV